MAVAPRVGQLTQITGGWNRLPSRRMIGRAEDRCAPRAGPAMKRAVLTSVIVGLFVCAAAAEQAATVVGGGDGPVIDPGYYRAVREKNSDSVPTWILDRKSVV